MDQKCFIVLGKNFGENTKHTPFTIDDIGWCPEADVFENQELIVLAVNSHEALIEAAKYAICSDTCPHNKCQGLRDALKLAERK
jgi:hypothetical protein